MYQNDLSGSRSAWGLTRGLVFLILLRVKTSRGLVVLLALAALCATGAHAQIGTAGGLLPAPPSIGSVVASGPAIERTIPGNRRTTVPVVTSPNPFPALSTTVPFGYGNFPTFTSFPVNTFPVNNYPSSFTMYPQGYAVFTDGLGNRTFIPRGSALLGNRGYGYNETPARTQSPAPAAPAPAPAPPEPVAVAPEPAPRREPLPLPQNPAELNPDATLEGLLRQEIEDRPDLRASVVIYDLVGKRKAEYHSPGEYYPGSIARLPVLIGAARELARGALDPVRRIELAPTDDGLSRKMGELVSVTELLQRMIRRGDLSAANALIDHVGFPSINDAVAATNLADTVLGRRFNDPRVATGQLPNRMPAVDAATLMYKLLRKDMPERGMATRMLDLLSRQTTTAGIPRLLRERPGTQVWGLAASAQLRNGHEVANDVAIVTGSGHAYVLAVYTDAPTDHTAWIGELAVKMHDALGRYRAEGAD